MGTALSLLTMGLVTGGAYLLWINRDAIATRAGETIGESFLNPLGAAWDNFLKSLNSIDLGGKSDYDKWTETGGKEGRNTGGSSGGGKTDYEKWTETGGKEGRNTGGSSIGDKKESPTPPVTKPKKSMGWWEWMQTLYAKTTTKPTPKPKPTPFLKDRTYHPLYPWMPLHPPKIVVEEKPKVTWKFTYGKMRGGARQPGKWTSSAGEIRSGHYHQKPGGGYEHVPYHVWKSKLRNKQLSTLTKIYPTQDRLSTPRPIDSGKWDKYGRPKKGRNVFNPYF